MATDSARLFQPLITGWARSSRWLLLAILCSCGFGPVAQAYTPDDPQVVAMVNRGVSFLTKAADDKAYSSVFAEGRILAGYAVYKVTGDKDLPVVKTAIARAVALANRCTNPERYPSDKIVYDVAVACLLLADLDPALYRVQLMNIREFFKMVQKPHGGFGYLENPSGDISQTQYAVLALWTLHKNGIEIPVENTEAVLRFLKMTQDPTGAWGYNGKLGTNQLIAQEAVSKSLATAGIGATLISADILGLWGNKAMGADLDDGVPKAFTRVDVLAKDRAIKKTISVKKDDLEPTINLAARYQGAQPMPAHGTMWFYYTHYSQERYESFLERVQGKRDRSPAWYNTGVEAMKKAQGSDGSWGRASGDYCPTEVCTAFAILYLIRSTQGTIARLNEGVLAGGYGLPTDVAKVRRVGDKIVGNETTSVEGLIGMLEKEDTQGVEVGMLPEDLVLSKDKAVRQTQVARLGRLLSSKDPKARRIAAKLIGRSEDLNQVPELIYALTDPDPYVPSIAEEGLRLLSRKLNARNVEVNATREQKVAAAQYWRDWYLLMRPDYIFVDR